MDIRVPGHQDAATDGASGADDSRGGMAANLKSPWNWNKIAIGAGAAVLTAGAAVAARRYLSGEEEAEDDFQLRLETDENLRLISSKKVEGTPVLDSEAERIGTIDSFMVDKYTGRLAPASRNPFCTTLLYHRAAGKLLISANILESFGFSAPW